MLSFLLLRALYHRFQDMRQLAIHEVANPMERTAKNEEMFLRIFSCLLGHFKL